jgi:hypothetical protein
LLRIEKIKERYNSYHDTDSNYSYDSD